MADWSSHIRRGQPIFMILFIVFAIIEGCITAWLVAQFNDNDNYPSHSYRDRLKFLVFTSWWTVFFSAVYLISFFVSALSFIASIASHGVFIFVTWVFWLAGVAAYTAALGGGKRCGHSTLIHCHQLVAAEAFGWITWITMSVALILLAAVGTAAINRGDRVSDGLVA